MFTVALTNNTKASTGDFVYLATVRTLYKFSGYRKPLLSTPITSWCKYFPYMFGSTILYREDVDLQTSLIIGTLLKDGRVYV